MFDMSAKNTVAKHIKIARVEQGITQAQLADMLDLSPQNIAKWESGEINLGVDTLERIANVLDKPIEWFFQPFESKKEPARQRKAA